MDLTSPGVIRTLQDKFDFAFKKGLGQNFLTSQEVLSAIREAAEPENGVLEIGPGFGVLTHELAQHSKKVVSIEIDRRLFPVLAYTLGEFENVEIVEGDVMKVDLSALIREKFGNDPISVAANLPYYITTPVISRLLEERLPLKNIVVMVQKEVAERLCAKPGTKEYGAISVLCQFYSEPEIVTTVPAELFVPRPKVDSAVLKMALTPVPRVQVSDEKQFFKTVKAAFSQRRKTLLNCLASTFGEDKTVLEKKCTGVGIDPKRRGETLSLEEFAALSDALFSR